MKFEQYYCVFYSFFLILSSVYKGYGGLKYPPYMWELELAAVVIFCLMQFQRLDLGFRANRNEHTVAMVCFSVFTVFSVLFYLFFSTYQTYVLVIDLVVGSIGCFFALGELGLGIYASILFKKNTRY